MHSKPQQEHEWLQKLVGDWVYDGECPAGPDQPPMKFEGTETVRSIGGLWVQGEGRGQMPDGDPATMIITIGYDPHKKRYVGTWIGSMMAYQWVYEGDLDASGKVLTLNSVGPKFGEDGTADWSQMIQYKDVIEFHDDDHRTLSGHFLGEDGQWVQMMATNYRRAT